MEDEDRDRQTISTIGGGGSNSSRTTTAVAIDVLTRALNKKQLETQTSTSSVSISKSSRRRVGFDDCGNDDDDVGEDGEDGSDDDDDDGDDGDDGNLSNNNAVASSTAAAEAEASAAAAARSFLYQTGSVYVLDTAASGTASGGGGGGGGSSSSTGGVGSSSTCSSTNTAFKIFGCWNFLHQAMNEIERRYEQEEQIQQHRNQNQNQNNQHASSSSSSSTSSLPHLLSETRLLAEFSVKVARRSDDIDKRMVSTCIQNYCYNSIATTNNAVNNKMRKMKNDNDDDDIKDQNETTNKNNNIIRVILPQLIHSNAEIREIVTGRIAAYSFHYNSSSSNHHTTTTSSSTAATASTSTNATSFEDPLVIETLCKFLAVNAVSNGPQRLQRFLNDWIIPGATIDPDSTTNDGAATAVYDDDENDVHDKDDDDDGSDEDDDESNYDNSNNKRQRSSSSSPSQSQSQSTTSSMRKRTKRKSSLLHHRLPPYSLACVLYHIASESENTTTTGVVHVSPFGTIDVLQRLSLPIMANVLLGPVLYDSFILLKQQKLRHQQQQQQNDDEDDYDDENNNKNNDSNNNDDINDRIIAMGINAISAWCKTTDLSLAQVKHIGSKVRINLTELLGEALQTDSPRVMNALADLIENVVERHVVVPPRQRQQQEPLSLISDARMTQTRYLMQVPDEVSFRSNISQEQLHTIETKELCDILYDLSMNVEKQRYRFPAFTTAISGKDGSDHQKQHSSAQPHSNERAHALGHSLARIAAAVCLGYAKVSTQQEEEQAFQKTTPITTANGADDGNDIINNKYRIPGSGLLELLSKCASHPSVAICGIVLPVVTPILRTEVGLATQWLPTLQRRAIIPHHPPSNNEDDNNTAVQVRPSSLLLASDICFVEFEEFLHEFRETVLKDALNACYGIHSEYYLASCTAAIEEFCVSDDAGTGGEQTSFHLEAALFCLVAVSEQVLPSVIITGSYANTNTNTNTNTTASTTKASTSSANIVKDANASNYLLRCTVALAKKPNSLSNPLTMAQACRFVRKYANWFGSDQHPGILDIAADLTLFILSQCSTSFPDTALSRTIYRESDVTCYSQAAKTLRCLLSQNPKHFLSNKAIAALGAGWEAIFVACNRSGKLLTIEDRKDTCIGICHVLASLPNDQQQTSLMALALASIACLEAMVIRAADFSNTASATLSATLDRAADEIIILATTARAYTDAVSAMTISGVVCSGRPNIVEPSMTVLRRAWSTISIAASKFSFHDSILDSLGMLFVECMPSKCNTNVSLSFLQDICALAKKVIESENALQNNRFFSPVLTFIEQSVETHGNTIEKVALIREDGDNVDLETSSCSENDKEIHRCLDSLTRATITAMTNQNLLGDVWASVQKQGNGQSASETKTKMDNRNNDLDIKVCSTGLAPLFSFLTTCAERCPVFLLHILAGHDEGGDYSGGRDLSMLREAMDGAVSSILHSQVEISIQAIKFLQSIVSLTQSTDTDTIKNNVRSLVDEYNLRCKTNVLCILLRGMCGMFQPAVVPAACRLLLHALSTSALSTVELKTLVLRGLSQEHFLLGDRAWRIIYDFCLQCLRSNKTLDEMVNIMTDIWQLHRFENVREIANSDVVHTFCIQYGSNK